MVPNNLQTIRPQDLWRKNACFVDQILSHALGYTSSFLSTTDKYHGGSFDRLPRFYEWHKVLEIKMTKILTQSEYFLQKTTISSFPMALYHACFFTGQLLGQSVQKETISIVLDFYDY